MESRDRVLVAMSGGVDSSTAALLLKEQGFQVVGCTMRLWDHRRNPAPDGEPVAGRCCTLDDVYDARRIAERLGFPFYVLNLEKPFERRVIEPFIGQYLSGQTPIPCTLCNTFLKFDHLLHFARRVGIGKVATGHYARVRHRPDTGFELLRGRDPGKDQTYYLFELTQEQLSRVLFPVGGYEKVDIRRIAGSHGLLTANKPDSQEICFIPDGDYKAFIRRHAGEVNADFVPLLEEREKAGPVLFKDGTPMGRHSGLHHFTIGQRRGLGIAHPRPLYVLRLDTGRNAVIVGYREDLFSEGLVTERVNWIPPQLPEGEIRVEVKIRARHRQAPARLQLRREDSKKGAGRGLCAQIWFDEPQASVTPGQAAVFYRGDQVLGGGWIKGRVPAG